jgi:NADPH-dependent curcumin reductase CurA
VNSKLTAKKGASSSKKHPSANDSDAENSPAPSTRNTKCLCKSGSFNIEGFMTEERQHRQEFQDKMLKHMAQGNIEFRKASKQTYTFQDDFLGFLCGVFPKN